MNHAGENSTPDDSSYDGNDDLECPACGAVARRGLAQYCATCGRKLTENYRPADALRASYHAHSRRRSPRKGMLSINRRNINPSNKPEGPRGFAVKNQNGASTTALAFATYALVPYLGILFCPGAVLMGGVGLLRSFRVPHIGGRRASYASVFFGLIILSVQLALWWILYKVPEWAQGRPL